MFSFREWNDDLLSTVCKSLCEEMALPPDVEGGMAQYRLSLCLSFFYKFFLFVQNQITANGASGKGMDALKVFSVMPLDILNRGGSMRGLGGAKLTLNF